MANQIKKETEKKQKTKHSPINRDQANFKSKKRVLQRDGDDDYSPDQDKEVPQLKNIQSKSSSAATVKDLPIKPQLSPKKETQPPVKLKCKYCMKNFTSRKSLTKHVDNSCKFLRQNGYILKYRR